MEEFIVLLRKNLNNNIARKQDRLNAYLKDLDFFQEENRQLRNSIVGLREALQIIDQTEQEFIQSKHIQESMNKMIEGIDKMSKLLDKNKH